MTGISADIPVNDFSCLNDYSHTADAFKASNDFLIKSTDARLANLLGTGV